MLQASFVDLSDRRNKMYVYDFDHGKHQAPSKDIKSAELDFKASLKKPLSASSSKFTSKDTMPIEDSGSYHMQPHNPMQTIAKLDSLPHEVHIRFFRKAEK